MKTSSELFSEAYTPPQAFWFGDEPPLLGWYHPAAAAHARDCGVVLCPPFGHEYMVSYLSYKHLATRLAEHGLAVCFFDYDGSGDSGDSDAARVATWQANIRAAADQLRQLSGCTHIALFGMRLGALLAASVAAELNAAALMLLAPVTSGRAYVRELQVLRSMSPIQANPADPANPTHCPGDDELTGYDWQEQTRTDLARLDLLKIARPHIPVLLQARDDISGSEARLAHAWHSDDHSLLLSTRPGYAAMMTEDAHLTTVPHALIAEAQEWLCSHFPVKKNSGGVMPVPLLPSSARIVYGAHSLREDLVYFAGMAGVLCRPAGVLSGHPACVILTNIGANHRVGNHRIYVTLARTLAAHGFAVLRFDKTGIGYSQKTPQGHENEVHDLCGVDDLAHAMSFLQQYCDARRFVLGGVCSGAYLSYRTAIADPRVAGLILINQLTYNWHVGDNVEVRRRNTIKSTDFYLRAAIERDTWKRVLTGKVAARQIAAKLLQRFAKRLGAQSKAALGKFLRNHRLLGPVARQFRALEKRGTELLFIFDADDSAIDLMNLTLGEGASLLGKSARVRVEIVAGIDHTFTPKWSQRYLADLVTQHLLRRFPASAAEK